MLGFRRKRTNLHEKYDYPYEALFRSGKAVGACGAQDQRVSRDVWTPSGYEGTLSAR